MQNNVKLVLSICVAVLIFSSLPSLAWGPLAHYLLAKKAHGATVAQYANIPDAWPSNTEPDYGLTVDITPYFCWSHGVRNTGVMNLVTEFLLPDVNPVEIPKIPDYHPKFNEIELGHVMGVFLDGKVNLDRRWPPLTTTNSEEDSRPVKTHLENAACGISCHNAKDRLVHWTYFLGATGNETSNSVAQKKWTIHHGLKEHWAEYIFLATQVLGKYELERTDFDSDGHIIFPSTKPDGTPVEVPKLAITGLDANKYDNDKINSLAWLLRLAQAAYNKNRTSRSTADASEYGLNVQLCSKIKDLLKAQDKLLRNYFTQEHWATWEGHVYGVNTHFNFQSGNLTVTLLDNTTETMDYDTPDNLWIEWQMLKNLAKNNYPDDWERDVLHEQADFTDIPEPTNQQPNE